MSRLRALGSGLRVSERRRLCVPGPRNLKPGTRAALDEVDAVDICTPPHLHAEMAVAAARAGKHVLTEKIMARTLPEARWMIDEAKRDRLHASQDAA